MIYLVWFMCEYGKNQEHAPMCKYGKNQEHAPMWAQDIILALRFNVFGRLKCQISKST